MRILLLQLKRIGDAILTTPVLAALRAHAPGSKITLALDATAAGLAPALDADRILVRGTNFWAPLARGGFDVCLDLTGNDRSALAALVSRAPRRITWQRFAKKPLRRGLYTDFIDSSVRDRHTADHHTDLLQALGIEVENVPLHLRLPANALAEAARALETAGPGVSAIDAPFAVVHPGTARPEKYWLPERWAEVITHLQRRHGLPVILTGGNDPIERAHLQAIHAALQKETPTSNPQTSNLTDLAGRLSLLGTAAVIARARLLCAVDSAPVHLADALGTPLVALFGPTNPHHWRPRRATSRIVTPPGGVKAPMDRLTVPAVQTALDHLAA